MTIEIIRSRESERLARRLQQIRNRNVALDNELMTEVAAIIGDVRMRGDAALIDWAARLDDFVMQPADLRVDAETLRSIAVQADANVVTALREAILRVRAFHKFERQHSWEVETDKGVRLGQRVWAIDRAGVYVPGGTASYPSSVVMNVVPAQIAGVNRIVVATPPRALQENPAVAAALVELGAYEVYAVGGAQAIAALAYGTETIPSVDKITGPGSKYVAAAKKLVFGVVGIDSIAGPTEVVIIADDSAPPSFVAADLLAQAEHGEDASALLLTTSDELAENVAAELERQRRELPRANIVARSLDQYGAIIIVDDLEEACALVNEISPEHLQIFAADEERIASRIRHAGAIFFGEQSPAAVGDYLAGPNHVLPTGGAARFSSALGVHDFLKRTSTLRFSAPELKATASFIATLARAEGFEAHARSALIRLESRPPAEMLGQAARTTPLRIPRSLKMRNALDSVKPQVRALRAYSLKAERTKVKLNQNENPWDVPFEIKHETLRRINEWAWSRYPDFTQQRLRERLAEFSGWRPEGIVAGNGSNELIQAVLMVAIGPGKRVLINDPTFALYRQITTILGGEVISVPLTLQLTYDAQALLGAVKSTQPHVIIICSPNNPTGCVIEESDLVSLLEASRGLVVVDEAYFEFSGQTAVPLLGRYSNLIVLRTFSKAMALAALRVGYLLSEPNLVREVAKALLPYNLNIVSQTAAEVAVEMFAFKLDPLVQTISSERDRLYAELKGIPGLIPIPSRANFMVVRSELEPHHVFHELRERDILIRDVSKYPRLQDYFRVSVGTPEENDLLLAALREIFIFHGR